MLHDFFFLIEMLQMKDGKEWRKKSCDRNTNMNWEIVGNVDLEETERV